MVLRDLGFMRSMDILMIVLLVIGGLNWGLFGLFSFNLVEFLFGGLPWLSKTIYGLVGFSALYEVFQWKAIQRRWECKWSPEMAHGTSH